MPSTLRRAVLSLTAIMILASPSWGQSMIRSITRFRVAPGHSGDFEAAVKDYNEVLKKAGWPQPMTRWRSTTGPSEYALTVYYRKYADLETATAQDPRLKDYAGPLAAAYARILACGQSAERIIDEIQPELSILSSEAPPLVRVLRTTVKPDRINDYIELLKSEAMPLLKQSGVKLYMVSRTRYGGPSTEFRAMAGVEKWADLEGGPSNFMRVMSPEKFAAFQKKYQSMVVDAQYDVYRYLPELSYIPARTASGR
jgi:quinol monooxygenase YgiN